MIGTPPSLKLRSAMVTNSSETLVFLREIHAFLPFQLKRNHVTSLESLPHSSAKYFAPALRVPSDL